MYWSYNDATHGILLCLGYEISPSFYLQVDLNIISWCVDATISHFSHIPTVSPLLNFSVTGTVW